MNDPDQNRKRLTVRQRDGVTVYCASAWPGRQDMATTLIAELRGLEAELTAARRELRFGQPCFQPAIEIAHKIGTLISV